MRLLRTAIFSCLHFSRLMARITGSGPLAADAVRPAAAPVPMPANGLKTALWRHHVKQFNEAACSAATVVSVVNAIREVQGYRGPVLDQREILRIVTAGQWPERLQPGGYKGRRGLPLALLGRVVRASLDVCRVRYRSVETVAAAKPQSAAANRLLSELRARLHRFETRGDVLVIAHFDQGALLPVLNIPHISPVGAFDGGSDRVTILDVDSDQAPYQVALPSFYTAIASHYHYLFKPLGYGRGGYVHIRLG